MSGLLGTAAIFSMALKDWKDGIAIGTILFLNAGIGFFQEFKAEKAMDALRSMAAPEAVVVREGIHKKIAARYLVPGDLILLQEGMRIPADARLIEVQSMLTMESSLTGESHAIEKGTEVKSSELPLAEQSHRIFLGTTVVKGNGRAEVTETGMRTEFGKIAQMVKEEKSGPTPLQIKMNRLTRILALVGLGMAALILLISILQGRDLAEGFLLSVSLLVGAIPEGLPAVITLTLALGAERLARKKALLRKLPAAEALGSVTVICTDKTGTLTQNQMTVRTVFVNGEKIRVEGEGYAPMGRIEKVSEDVLTLMRIGALCNNSDLVKENGTWGILGDPTEACLLTLAEKGGVSVDELRKERSKTKELVFDSERKRMSTLHGKWMATKGAVEGLLEICTHELRDGKIVKLTVADKARILKQEQSESEKGYRMLGFGMKNLKTAKEFKETDLTFVGMVAIMDPPRPEVKEAILRCHAAKIRVVMITGDQAITALAIAQEIGLAGRKDRVLTGQELDRMNERELSKKIRTTNVFARVNPAHKVLILKMLQKQGEVVAMTGDGVNDAPALKSADIGIAMGITGTDVSKEASLMILLDDNFATIVNSVELGRGIDRNIKKFIRSLLSANLGEVGAVMILFTLGFPMPLLPLQILWINLLTDALPALSLGLDPTDDDVMKVGPSRNKSLWNEIFKISVFSGILGTLLGVGLFLRSFGTESLEHTRTMVFSGLVIFELIMTLSVRFLNRPFYHKITSNLWLIAAMISSFILQMLAVYWSFLQNILQTVPLSWNDWLWIFIYSFAGMMLIELWKKTQKKRA